MTAVCRTNYDAVKAKGITIRSKIFGKCYYKPTAVKSVSEAQGPFDFIIVCSKAFPGTSEMIKDAVSMDTAIVLAQNGIGIEDEYAKLYPNNTIISGVVWLPTTQVEPGIIEMGPLERFEIGTFPADAGPAAKAKAQQLSDIYKSAGATCPVSEDIQIKRWPKIAVNAAWNATCALTLCDDGNFMRSSDMAEEMIIKIFRQVGTIAKAAGHDVVHEDWIQNQLELNRGRKIHGGKEPSMLTDIRHERPIEVEAILGNLVKIANKHSVEAPYIELLYTLAQARNFALLQNENWLAKMEIGEDALTANGKAS